MVHLQISPPKEPGLYVAADLRYSDKPPFVVNVLRHPNGAICVNGDPNLPVQVHPYLWAGPITKQDVRL